MNWVWEPSVLLGLLLLTGWYGISTTVFRRNLSWGEPVSLVRQACFHGGTLCVFIALASPIDSLGDTSLFSAHMVQHMLLTFAAPLLWVVGTPGWLVEKLLPFTVMQRGFRWITQPVVAFFIFNGVMWFWHIPRMYDLALQHEGLHIAEHMMYMGGAVIGWYPVFGQYGHIESLPVILMYLLASMFACTALAALIALSPRLLYTFYGDASLTYGLIPLTDQQIGGAIMWLPGDMIYMGIIAGLFYRLLNIQDAEIERIAA